jgi:hypothetical protein
VGSREPDQEPSSVFAYWLKSTVLATHMQNCSAKMIRMHEFTWASLEYSGSTPIGEHLRAMCAGPTAPQVTAVHDCRTAAGE